MCFSFVLMLFVLLLLCCCCSLIVFMHVLFVCADAFHEMSFPSPVTEKLASQAPGKAIYSYHKENTSSKPLVRLMKYRKCPMKVINRGIINEPHGQNCHPTAWGQETSSHCLLGSFSLLLVNSILRRNCARSENHRWLDRIH